MWRFGIAALALLAADTARADFDPGRRGFYLGLGATFGVYARVAEDLEKGLAALGYVVDLDQEEPLGLNARVGYRAHPRLAGELEFEWLPEADLDIRGFTLGKLQSWTATANAKGYLLTGRYQPFVLVGVGVIQTRGKSLTPLLRGQTTLGLATRFGAGFEIHLTESLVATLGGGYVLPFGEAEGNDYGLVDWGLAWRF